MLGPNEDMRVRTRYRPYCPAQMPRARGRRRGHPSGSVRPLRRRWPTYITRRTVPCSRPTKQFPPEPGGPPPPGGELGDCQPPWVGAGSCRVAERQHLGRHQDPQRPRGRVRRPPQSPQSPQRRALGSGATRPGCQCPPSPPPGPRGRQGRRPDPPAHAAPWPALLPPHPAEENTATAPSHRSQPRRLPGPLRAQPPRKPCPPVLHGNQGGGDTGNERACAETEAGPSTEAGTGVWGLPQPPPREPPALNALQTGRSRRAPLSPGVWGLGRARQKRPRDRPPGGPQVLGLCEAPGDCASQCVTSHQGGTKRVPGTPQERTLGAVPGPPARPPPSPSARLALSGLCSDHSFGGYCC